MINNFQLKPRYCVDHNQKQQFICTNKECESKSLLCSQCARSKHSSHFYDIRSIQNFIESFKQKVKYYGSQFEKDKVIIHVKDIVASKISEVNQNFHQLLINIMKALQQQRQAIIHSLKQVQQKYDDLQTQYKKNLQQRYQCLQYLSAYKNSPKALQAKILCSNVWGLSNIKNSLADIKTLSTNQSRDVNSVKNCVIQQLELNLKQDLLFFNLKRFLQDFESEKTSCSKEVFSAEKVIANISLQKVGVSTARSSRTKTHSLSGLYRNSSARIASNPSVDVRNTSLQNIQKVPSQSNMDSQKKFKLNGVKKFPLSKIIIKG